MAESDALPPRRAGALRLSYDEGSETLFVIRFGYSASLACAANEGELSDDRGDGYHTLTHREQAVVDEWMDHADALLDAARKAKLAR